MLELAKRKSRHAELKELLLKKISSSSANSLLPSEISLAKTHGVCRATVNKAMVELEQEGYIIRRAGKGTFVAPRDRTIVHGGIEQPRTQGDVIIAYPDFFSYTLWECVHLSEMEALKNNLNLISLKLNENSKLESLENILKKSDNIVGAILIGIIDKTLTHSLLERLDSFNIPVVLSSSHKKINTYKNVFMITGDHKKSGYLKMNYLLKNGHRKIGFITNEPKSEAGTEHIKGIKQALYDNNMRWKDLVQTDMNTKAWEDPGMAGYKMAKDLLSRHKDLTALLVETFTGAFGALRALYELNLKCPDDISIVTATNLFGLEELTCPRLSSVTTPTNKLIEMIFEIIVKQGDVPTNSIIVDSELLERESVKDIK